MQFARSDGLAAPGIRASTMVPVELIDFEHGYYLRRSRVDSFSPGEIVDRSFNKASFVAHGFRGANDSANAGLQNHVTPLPANAFISRMMPSRCAAPEGLPVQALSGAEPDAWLGTDSLRLEKALLPESVIGPDGIEVFLAARRRDAVNDFPSFISQLNNNGMPVKAPWRARSGVRVPKGRLANAAELPMGIAKATSTN